jgi:hypothetical protein
VFFSIPGKNTETIKRCKKKWEMLENCDDIFVNYFFYIQICLGCPLPFPHSAEQICAWKCSNSNCTEKNK